MEEKTYKCPRCGYEIPQSEMMKFRTYICCCCGFDATSPTHEQLYELECLLTENFPKALQPNETIVETAIKLLKTYTARTEDKDKVSLDTEESDYEIGELGYSAEDEKQDTPDNKIIVRSYRQLQFIDGKPEMCEGVDFLNPNTMELEHTTGNSARIFKSLIDNYFEGKK